MSRERGDLGAHVGLCRMRISLFSSLSAATSFLIARSGPGPEMLPLATGVFLLACGSSALNQCQERTIDALMPRTRTRPIPSGRISPLGALCFSLALIFSGTLTLLLTGSVFAPLLGLAGVLWYNGFYTTMKRRTAFAAVPGALVGTITPAIGWVAGNGSLSDPRLLSLCFFFFMWQVPHFWLLLLDHGEEYEKAGLPSLTGIFARTQLLRIIFIWIFATAVSCLFISVTGMIRTPAVNYLLFGASLWLIWSGLTLLRRQAGERLASFTFRRINIYMLFVMVLLSVDRLFV
jgi:protoheme IX farnesyltransferase